MKLAFSSLSQPASISSGFLRPSPSLSLFPEIRGEARAMQSRARQCLRMQGAGSGITTTNREKLRSRSTAALSLTAAACAFFIYSGSSHMSLAMAVASMFVVLLTSRGTKTPTTEEILRMGKPRVCGGDDWSQGEGKRVGEAVRREVEALILEGREVGVSVSVHLKGRELATVVGGVYSPLEAADGSPEWLPVTPKTMFMSYSVVKGIAATALLTCVDAAEVRYDQPVSELWPAFGNGGKDTMTVQVGDSVFACVCACA